MKKISELSDPQLAQLIESRWNSSSTVWEDVIKTYEKNLKIYQNEADWHKEIPRKRLKVRANRIFVNMESVINSLIANPPRPNLVPGRGTVVAKQLCLDQEKYFQVKYMERNIKEQIRKGLRNLYFGRLLVLKPYWDAKINDFNVRAIDPRKIRVSKNATKEPESEFMIEEVEDDLLAVMRRFPKQAKSLMEINGFETEEEVLIKNPTITYKEAWVRDYVIFKYNNQILGIIQNPYWDWEGLLMTPQEELELNEAEGDARRTIMRNLKVQQPERQARMQQAALVKKNQEDALKKGITPPAPTGQESYVKAEITPAAPGQPPGAPAPQPIAGQPVEAPRPAAKTDLPYKDDQKVPIPTPEMSDTVPNYRAYYFNHFDYPRKPYIIATIFNNENKPVGQTDMITQAAPLQEDVDKTKQDISENAKIVNGTILIDSSVMSKEDAQKLRWEVGGIIWGKGVLNGVKRMSGEALPAFVVGNLQDSRQAIDDAMAATSAFKGQREGQETKAGRLQLIDQSYLRLNELVQVVDYVSYEMFNWFYQLAKVRYTEHHYAKTMGKAQAVEILTLLQDDFIDGTEVRVIPGKMLPEDREFKYEQAQNDVKNGLLSPVDYFEIAGYDMPADKAKNRVVYDFNRAHAVGITPAEFQSIYIPPIPKDTIRYTIDFKDLPPDGKVQVLARTGVQVDPRVVAAEAISKTKMAQQESTAKVTPPVPAPLPANKKGNAK